MSEQNNESPLMSTPERRILGELGNSNPDSPTANLRLLTNLASTLKNASSIDESPCQSCSASSSEVVRLPTVRLTGETSSCLKLLPRKEKSLSLLCNKFLNLFPLNIQENSPKEISLNTTATALGTEKRRIYDIINVLESLEMASKAGKNQYYWHGQSRLSMTLAKLKMSAIELGLDKQIQEIQRINRAYIENSCQSCGGSSSTLMVPQSPVVDYCFPDVSVKEDKSLGVMCRKFVMLFLVSLKNGVINLDIAAKVLINEQDSPMDSKSSTAQSHFKTKVRRLYDIANVLSAIGLIEKVDLYNCVIRKPIFKYTGPSVGEINFDPEDTKSLIGMTTPHKRHSDTFNFRTLTRISRLCSSTPSGNKRETRKRKLFDSDNKFERTKSSPCLSMRKNRSSERLDDSILQVVEMELNRMKSNETKPKVCTKLFPRHSSDSSLISNETNDTSKPEQPNVVKENLVNESASIRTVRINVPLEFKIAPTPPKFVKLTKLDMKKLVPITKSNVTYLTKIPAKKISPGDTFKAIKVGNTFQLVPIERKSDNNN